MNNNRFAFQMNRFLSANIFCSVICSSLWIQSIAKGQETISHQVPTNRPTSIIIRNRLLTEIREVRLADDKKIVIVHEDGVLIVNPSMLSLSFLQRWGIGINRPSAHDSKSFSARGTTASALPVKNEPVDETPIRILPESSVKTLRTAPSSSAEPLPNSKSDKSFDSWQDIWGGFPNLSVDQILATPEKFQNQLVCVKGKMGNIQSSGNGDYFDLMDEGQRLRIMFTILVLASAQKKSIRTKMEQLKDQPSNFSKSIWVVGEVGKTAGALPYLELVDFKIVQ